MNLPIGIPLVWVLKEALEGSIAYAQLLGSLSPRKSSWADALYHRGEPLLKFRPFIDRGRPMRLP